ncbi:DUF6163 family protein [Microvirga sp. W0021]|uniref:DUF6163 family protein n=1 Tax=Hohaiivirga grylli TaxID=3133970 RepID=A0ABV0BI21_9HYPH
MFGFLQKQKEKIGSASDALRTAAESSSFIRWHTVLTIFARIVALLWLMKGLAGWSAMIGVLGDGGDFVSRSIQFQSTVIYFSTIDVIAAVGLWMISAWGGVVWLIAVMSYIVIATLFPGMLAMGPWIAWTLGFLVLAYLSLMWLGAREDNR